MDLDAYYEPIILVKRGDELPKKNFEKKLHPTYETSIYIKNTDRSTTPHMVVKFFDQYRALYESLNKLNIGENKLINIDASFPPSFKTSMFGLGLTEEQLQERCYLLNKWMQSVFASYHLFPEDAQQLISEFLSLNDDNEVLEANKELILSLLRRKIQSVKMANTESNGQLSSLAGNDNNNIYAHNHSTNTPHTSYKPLEKASEPLDQSDENTNEPDPSTRSASMVTLAPKPATKRPFSTRGSVYSEVPMSFSPAELEEYSKETIVSSFLAVSVLRGDMLPKSPNDPKLHHAYEAIVRVLPWVDLPLEVQSMVNMDQYQQHATLPTVITNKVFDNYRSLMLNLEEVGVVPMDHADRVTEEEEIVVIPAPFPRTYRRSALGFGLSESQLQTRVVLLNRWMGQLLKSFPKLPEKAKLLICEFFDLEYLQDPKLNPLTASGLFNIMLENLYFAAVTNRGSNDLLPRLPTESSEPEESEKNTENKGTYQTLTSANLQKLPPNANLTQPSLASTPPTSPTTAVVATKALPTETLLGNTTTNKYDFTRETTVHGLLGVSVGRGASLSKTNASKLHPGYETIIRILPYDEITLANKGEIDVLTYTRLQSSLSYQTINRTFDQYRNLQQTLEKQRVISHDRIEYLQNNGEVVVIPSSFPQTYTVSSFGLSLSEQQLTNRMMDLNRWVGSLLSKYHLCSDRAKDLINEFFELDADNPAEPQNAIILAMLEKTFEPVTKAEIAAQTKEANSRHGTGLFGSLWSTSETTKGGKETVSTNAGVYHKGNDNSLGNNDTEMGNQGQCCVPGGACVIM